MSVKPDKVTTDGVSVHIQARFKKYEGEKPCFAFDTARQGVETFLSPSDELLKP